MFPKFQCKDHGGKLVVMGGVIFLIRLELLRSIRYYLIFLHQYTPQTVL